MIQKYQNTKDHSSWNIGNGDPMHEVCIPQNSKGEARGRNRHKNNARVVRNLEERNVGTKGKNSKQGLICDKNLTIELLEGRDSPYHRFD